MSRLSDRLLDESVRPELVKECCAIIDRQVDAKRGFSGIAIKGAYKTVKAIKRGFVPGVVEALLDEWVGKLGEFEVEHGERGASGSLADYLIAERERVAAALISVTDGRAETTKHTTAKKFYLRLRPSALANVEEAIPELAQLVTRFDHPVADASTAAPPAG